MLRMSARVADALAAGRPVVALESTVIAHGLPRPQNLELANRLESILEARGVAPATIGLIDGEVVVGLSSAELELIAGEAAIAKVSMRDLAAVAAMRLPGATTVATTIWAAANAGIRVMATGGIGGVHRGAEQTFDVSADMSALAKHRLAVVCSGAKSILDLPKTLEVLESLGVPVVGYRTGEFPAFYARSSGLMLGHVVNSPEAAAAVLLAQERLGLSSGIVFANPVPGAAALEDDLARALVAEAVAAAETAGIEGGDLTPYLLSSIAERSEGRSLEANLALLEANTAVAADIAVALHAG